MSGWKPEDIAWDRFDPGLVDPEVVKLIKAAALVEYNARDYATYLENVLAAHPDLKALAWDWAQSEVQHGETLARWARLADPSFDFGAAVARFTTGFRVPLDRTVSVRGSVTGEFLARCVVETGTSTYYTALLGRVQEPVLRQLLGHIAADELRHYKTFHDLARLYQQREKVGFLERLRVVWGRVVESEDEELAYAYYAANGAGEAWDHKRFAHAFMQRAYPLYPRELVQRIVGMLFKILGLAPHGWLSRMLARIAHRFMRWRAERLAREAS
jgi:rubrerythrin